MCRGLLSTVVSIMGILLYEVKFVVSGDVDTVQKHMLHDIEDVDEILLAIEVLDDLLNSDIVDVPEAVASDSI